MSTRQADELIARFPPQPEPRCVAKRAGAIVAFIALAGGIATESGFAGVILEDFEKDTPVPAVWVVNIPDENASAQFSSDQPREGKRCLKLHYHFVGAGQFQYLGIPIRVALQSPVHHLRFWLKGDNSKCSYGVQVSDASGETHQFSKNTGQGGMIDFTGWKEIVIDMDTPHETWGGDKNGKLDFPVALVTFTIGQPMDNGKFLSAEGDLYFDALSASSEKGGLAVLPSPIAVVSPEYCSDVHGDTTIALAAPGFTSVTAKCWKQGEGFGADSTVATVALDDKGNGSFVFPANTYPHGPVTVRISGQNGATKDNCYLQLYNRGGVSWNEGVPAEPPPAARGMSLVFADDFKSPLSISSSDPNAVYYDHKPPDGYQDFSTLRFTGFHERNNPFYQVDTYLRIRASEKSRSAGLLSSMKNNATGVTAKAPCYFECRFIGPNAIGAWPAFWLLSDYMTDHAKGIKTPCDELDIIEAYGGEGPREPNAFDTYMITPHCWDQGEAGKTIEKKAFDQMRNPVRMRKFGVPSAWFEAFHTYGCKITVTNTIYYCDNIEVGRHATLPLSKTSRFFFLINLATGGGWPVDLSRYHGIADMYVDFVRVYQGKIAGNGSLPR
jgi:beta-glucanase (GH16 family)